MSDSGRDSPSGEGYDDPSDDEPSVPSDEELPSSDSSDDEDDEMEVDNGFGRQEDEDHGAHLLDNLRDLDCIEELDLDGFIDRALEYRDDNTIRKRDAAEKFTSYVLSGVDPVTGKQTLLNMSTTEIPLRDVEDIMESSDFDSAFGFSQTLPYNGVVEIQGVPDMPNHNDKDLKFKFNVMCPTADSFQVSQYDLVRPFSTIIFSALCGPTTSDLRK